MTTTDAPAVAVTRPDLAPLPESDPETVAHILCAEFGGAGWKAPLREGRPWCLAGAGTAVHLWGGASISKLALPRPLHDDGDAWRLMVREKVAVVPADSTLPETIWHAGLTSRADSRDPRRSVVLRALHKHSQDPRWSSLIPSVIERLEQAQ